VAYSVIDRRPQLFLSRFCQAHDIQLLAYGTLAGGFLSERYRGLPADKCVGAGLTGEGRLPCMLLDALQSAMCPF
jgi:aryl-alcohol dehydrogenase-like predicted oxidoreductase